MCTEKGWLRENCSSLGKKGQEKLKFLCCFNVKKTANRVDASELKEGNFADVINLIRHFEFLYQGRP